MKEKTKLRIIQILCIVSLLITVFSIQRTYAKYFEKVDTTYLTHIKRWVINVNNSNIHENQALNEIMEPVLVENENMYNNILVPGREGYFDFLINYTNVDLDFQFEFDFEQINKKTVINAETGESTQVDAHLEDFEVYGYSIINGSKTETVAIADLSEIKPIIDIETNTVIDSNIETEKLEELNTADTDKNIEIRILFRWNDENADTEDLAEVEGMNNFEDTQFRGETDGENLNTLLKYNVGITFTQYIQPNIS